MESAGRQCAGRHGSGLFRKRREARAKGKRESDEKPGKPGRRREALLRARPRAIPAGSYWSVRNRAAHTPGIARKRRLPAIACRALRRTAALRNTATAHARNPPAASKAAAMPARYANRICGISLE